MKATGVSKSMTFQLRDQHVEDDYGVERQGLEHRMLESVPNAPTSSGLGDLRLLVLNCNGDYIMNTTSQEWPYDNPLWDGCAKYLTREWCDLQVNANGFWKDTEDGRLVFVGVNGAGHGVPGYPSEARYHILQRRITIQWR